MPTIKDIAREAGVSHGTVSNVLNKTGKVSSEKIRLVEEAVKRLGYAPNTQAQMLRQGTPTSVAVIIPSLQELTYLDMYTALQTTLIQAGYDVNCHITNDIAENEKSILRRLPRSHLAAIVTVSCLAESEPHIYQNFSCPIFFAERIPDDLLPGWAAVSFDYFAAGLKLGNYINSRHWKRVAYFSTSGLFRYTNDVYAGMMQALVHTDSRIQLFSSDMNLTTAKAFEIAQNIPAFDCVVTNSALRAGAVENAIHISGIADSPGMIVVGASGECSHVTYEFDYCQAGVKISEYIINRQKAENPKKTLLEGKGIPYVFPQITPQKPCELTMLTLDSPSTSALEKLVPFFETSSGIHLKIMSVPYDDLHAQISIMNDRFYYDLVRMDVARAPELGEKTYLPLETVDIMPEMLPEKLVSASYNKYSIINGTRYMLPFDPSVQIFLYRRDLFQDAKLQRAYYERFREHLCVPETIEQYLRVAEFFTEKYNPESPTKYGTTFTLGNSAFAACDFLPYYLACSRGIQEADGKIRLNTPEMRHAMKQYLKMSQFAVIQDNWRDSAQQFANGDVATTAIYSNHAASIINSKHSHIVGKIDAGIYPGRHPLLGGGVLGISKYSRNIEACRQFFNWYYCLDVASLIVQLGGTSPLLDVYNDFRHYNIFPWMNASKKSFEIGTRGAGGLAAPQFSITHYEFALGNAIRNAIAGTGSMNEDEAADMAQRIYENTPLSLM